MQAHKVKKLRAEDFKYQTRGRAFLLRLYLSSSEIIHYFPKTAPFKHNGDNYQESIIIKLKITKNVFQVFIAIWSYEYSLKCKETITKT